MGKIDGAKLTVDVSLVKRRKVRLDDLTRLILTRNSRNKDYGLGELKSSISCIIDGGSSGSPIFNKSWKVVAIHHAGGLYDVDGSGRKMDANQGIIMKDVVAFLNKK